MTEVEKAAHMTENEKNIIAVLEWLCATKAPPDRIASAMQRLLAQMPKPPPVIFDGKRRREELEKLKQPSPWMPGPVTDERPDGVRRAAELEKLKKPSWMQGQLPVIDTRPDGERRREELEKLKGP